MDRIDQILNAKSTILEPKHPKPLNDFTQEIEYRNVSFAYRPDRIVLKEVNITIKKGQTIALVDNPDRVKVPLSIFYPVFTM